MDSQKQPRKRSSYSSVDEVLAAVFMDDDSVDEDQDEEDTFGEKSGSDSDYSFSEDNESDDEVFLSNSEATEEDQQKQATNQLPRQRPESVRTRGVGVRLRGQRRAANNNVRGRGCRFGRGGGRSRGPEWDWFETNLDDFQPKDLVFSGIEGLRVRTQSTEPYDFFKMYITDDIVNLIVQETNRYADQYLEQRGDELKEHSRVKSWFPTNSDEIRTFIGLTLLMGIIYKPRIQMYWSSDELLSTPLFSQVMTRDRYLLLMKFLHFANNQDPDYNVNDPNHDRLHKVREFIRKIQSRCRNVYEPGKNLSVDESLLLFKGRLHFRQFIRTKRARFGIKFYELCTNDGITLDFLIYSGEHLFRDHDNPVPEMLATEQIPVNLMQHYLNKGHTLYTDNYYTSPALAKYFLENKTYLCGTINPKRQNYAKSLIEKQIEKGEALFSKSGDYLAVKFRALQNKSGNKPKQVYMLTTEHTPIMVETGKTDKDGNKVMKPKCIHDYNRHMGGVDLVDMQLHSLKTVRKSYKWYSKIVFRLIMQCALNSHKIFVKTTGSKQDFLKFMQDVIQSLLLLSPRMNRELTRVDTLSRLTGRHFPIQKPVSSDERKDKRPSKACRVCYARGLRLPSGREIRTVWICEDCPSHPGLHIDKDCFRAYHSQLDYSVHRD